MFFTQEDYLKIKDWLQSSSVKDSLFTETDYLNTSDFITILQEGENKRISAEVLLEQINKNSKTAYQMLVDAGLYDKTETEFIQTLADCVEGRYLVEGDVTNIPDEEDLTEDDDKLKFKDREVSTVSYIPKGYVTLRRHYSNNTNILLQSAINKANTIYEIRYTFDLQGKTINLPDNCVLKFKGGKLKNGVISANNIVIDSKYSGIFSDITFTGKILKTYRFKVDWFISEFVDELTTSTPSIDNSVEINNLIKQGIKNIEFSTDRYYYIKNAIVVDGDTNFYTDKENTMYENAISQSLNVLGCIYSNEIITLLDYKYNPSVPNNSLFIGNIHFYCGKPFTSLSNIDTPIVRITNTGASILWGALIKASIRGTIRGITLNGNVVNSVSYTGLLMEAKNQAITYVHYSGYISNVYLGFKCLSNDNTYFTGFMSDGDTWCAKGGEFSCGSPVVLRGRHQPLFVHSSTNELGYFEGKEICLQGYVWDTNLSASNNNNKYWSCKYPLKISDEGRVSELNNRQLSSQQLPLWQNNKGLINLLTLDDSNNGYPYTNLLYEVLSTKFLNEDGSSNAKYIKDFKYTINDTDIYNIVSYDSKAVLINGHNLFNDISGISSPKYNYSTDILVDTATLITYRDSANYNRIYISFTIPQNCIAGSLQDNIQLLVAPANTSGNIKATINITQNGQVKVYSSIDNPERNWHTNKFRCAIPSIENSDCNVEISFEFDDLKDVVLPSIAVLVPSNIKFIYGGPTSKRPVFYGVGNKAHKGLQYYDTDLKTYIVWDGSKWALLGAISDEQNTINSEVETRLATVETNLNEKVIEAGGVEWDTIPTNGSTNAVNSNGIYDYAVTTEAESKLQYAEYLVPAIDNYIAVPKYLDCPINESTDIFWDNVVTDGTNLIIQGNYTDTNIDAIVKTLTKDHWRFSPTTLATLPVNIRKYNDNLLNVLDSKLINVRFIPKTANTDTKNICICGDSLVQGTAAVSECYRLLTADGASFNQIGTRSFTLDSVTYYHEGRGSWGWLDYVNPTYENTLFANLTNAFMHNGVLDFQNYMNTNYSSLSNKNIDYFIISLGTNDITQGRVFPTDATINNIISSAKTFINALLSSNKGFPNCKVAIGLPAIGAPSFATGRYSAELFRFGIMKLNKAMIDTFDNGKYKANVTCVMHGAYIDRANNYAHESVTVSPYNSETVTYYTNSCHPLVAGYKQWGRGYYGKIRAFLNGNL